jgi:medium-chain acyl-[acyl-carrier-protein] hydrolase
VYRSWPRRLAHDVEVVAATFPGRAPGSKVAPPSSIGDLVRATRRAVLDLEARDPLPFSFFGHSMGALIAFELTVDLERSGGASPQRLFVSGRRPPDERHDRAPIHGFDDDRFLDAVQATYGGVPDAVRSEPELLALFLPALRADVRAFETHIPLEAAVVHCPVNVYGGSDDRHPSPHELIGWQRVAATEIALRIFDGDHFYLATSESSITALTTDIASSLSPSFEERCG